MRNFTTQPWECDFRTHPENSPLVGVIAESRDHPDLEYALRNFSCMLPYASLIVYYSPDNIETIKRVIGPDTNVKLWPLPYEPFKRLEWAMLFTQKLTWDRLSQYDRVILFSVDTGIRHNSILKFMKYDFIGAHWLGRNPSGNPDIFQGNGGFSIRNPKLMAEIAWAPCPNLLTEDVWFKLKWKTEYPDAVTPENIQVCEAFSTEEAEVEGTMGFHDNTLSHFGYWKVFELADGPQRNLFEVRSATLDGRDVYDIVRLGVGPNSLRVFDTIGKGILKINDTLVFDLSKMKKVEISASCP